jgi:hypothetical protein
MLVLLKVFKQTAHQGAIDRISGLRFLAGDESQLCMIRDIFVYGLNATRKAGVSGEKLHILQCPIGGNSTTIRTGLREFSQH